MGGVLPVYPPQKRCMPPLPMGRPRNGSMTKIQKNSLPGVPMRGPEMGFLCREHDFHGTGVD